MVLCFCYRPGTMEVFPKITLVLAAGLLLISACQHEQEPPDTGLAGYDPDLIEKQRAQCEAKGGRFGKGGLGGSFVCYENTRDANKSCRSGLDCEGLCLARSRTCSPVKPFFGCHDILSDSGLRSTLCID